jgi:hydrogenase-1 operon protein HyaF
MKQFPIPVHVIGPGTQAEVGEDFSYMPFPREVPTFAMPQVPENAEAAAMSAARDVLTRFLDGMGSTSPPRIDLVGFHAGGLEVLNQSLGEGEVSVRITATFNGAHEVRIQETVFAGVWRERHYDGAGNVLHDYLEAGGIPAIALDNAQRAATAVLPAVEIPPGAMNSPALLTEIREQVRQYHPGRPAHVINLSLLPLSPADQQLLDRLLPPGPVAILSRGFGNCRISSTLIRHLWRVQYFNSMQTLILNTLEIVDVPEVALAAAEDLTDSRERLADLLDWMSESAVS